MEVNKPKRVVLKLSGESLKGDQEFGIDSEVLKTIATEIKKVSKINTQVSIVAGGGNFWRGAEFEKRGVAVVGASCDTEETHLAWLMTDKDKGGIAGVTYPLVADPSKTVATNFGVLAGDWSYDEEGNPVGEGITVPVEFRGTFFIDKEGIVRHETINDLPLGRNIDEMLRIVDAWHHVEKHGEVCPANWEEGKTAMSATRDGVAEYLSNN